MTDNSTKPDPVPALDADNHDNGADPALPPRMETPAVFTPIPDINEFARLVTLWHQNRLRQLIHLSTIPPEAGVTISVAKNEEITLTGDLYVGFTAGMKLAALIIEELPFMAEIDAKELQQQQQGGSPDNLSGDPADQTTGPNNGLGPEESSGTISPEKAVVH